MILRGSKNQFLSRRRRNLRGLGDVLDDFGAVDASAPVSVPDVTDSFGGSIFDPGGAGRASSIEPSVGVTPSAKEDLTFFDTILKIVKGGKEIVAEIDRPAPKPAGAALPPGYIRTADGRVIRAPASPAVQTAIKIGGGIAVAWFVGQLFARRS